jgi:hypothetical protein
MSFKDRTAVIEFVEETYFGNVHRNNLTDVIDCFTSSATVFIRHGDNPVRKFSVAPTSDADNLHEFYDHLCSNYDRGFGEFSHFVDIEAQSSACYFTVRMTPKPDGLYADAGEQILHNCNFFEYVDGRIQHMIIYYSNSEPGGNRPTGYPK